MGVYVCAMFDMFLRYKNQLGKVKYECHFEAAKTIIGSLEQPNLAFGILHSQLDEILDPSLYPI